MPAKPKAKPRSAKRGGLGYAIEHAAYHEAGHAVLALVCQATVRRATIKPRGNRRGRVIFDSHLEPTADLMMLIALAGPFTQRRFAPKSDLIAASDFNSVLKAIFDKGNGSAKRKENIWQMLQTTPNRQSLSFGTTSRSQRGRCSSTRR